MNTNEIYRQVTQQIIESLEAGVLPWKRPWVGAGLPKNAESLRSYGGVNILLLWIQSETKNWSSSNLWGSYKCWQRLKGNVKRGEKGTRIVFWDVRKRVEKDAETGEEKERKIFLAKRHTVFNLHQVTGKVVERLMEEQEATTNFENHSLADEVIASTGADIFYGGTKAGYNLTRDEICLPPKCAFTSPDGFYSTAFHELAHWTGHPSRLDRLQKNSRFGEKSYSFEELIAECASSFICSTLKIENVAASAAYLASWLEVLKSDSKAIFTASTAASAASDFILSFSKEAATADEVAAVT